MGTDCLFGLFAANTFIVIPLLLLGAGMLLVPTGLNVGQVLAPLLLLAVVIDYIWNIITLPLWIGFMPLIILEDILLLPAAILYWTAILSTPVLVPAFFLFPILLLLFIPVGLFNKALVGLVAWPITMWIPGQLPLYLL